MRGAVADFECNQEIIQFLEILILSEYAASSVKISTTNAEIRTNNHRFHGVYHTQTADQSTGARASSLTVSSLRYDLRLIY